MPGISSGFFGSSKVVRKLGDVNYAPTQKECKKILAWSKEVKTLPEANFRKDIARILTVVIPIETKNLNFSYKDPSGLYEVVQTERGYQHVFNFRDLSLTLLPNIKAYHNSKIKVLDLSGNLLTTIPNWGCCLHVIMSGNPLNECLDSVRGDILYLELKNCGIKELTPGFFADLKAMSRQHNNLGPWIDSSNGIVYKINFSGNPLSEKSLSYIKAYAGEGYILPEIIFDEGEEVGISSSDLAKKVIRNFTHDPNIRVLRNENKANKGFSATELIVAEYNKKIEEKARVKEIEEGFLLITEYFGIENLPSISNIIKNKFADFLKEIRPLSEHDAKFKEYVRGIFNELFNDKNLTGILLENLKHDHDITFNKINECMLMNKVMKGEFDNNPKLLGKSLRDLFLAYK